MSTALWLLAAQGVLGAFDTLYYHEWRAQLPARGASAAKELKLHAARDFLYAALFGSLRVRDLYAALELPFGYWPWKQLAWSTQTANS